MSWIKSFTVAIVEENCENIGKLIETMPTFDSIEEAQSARALIQEALIIMEREKTKTYDTMQKIKKTRTFIINSSQSHEREYRG